MQGMSGCLIAVLVCAALALPTVGILAAIAVPAYNDYVQRAKITEVVAAVATLQLTVREHVAGASACPDNDKRRSCPAASCNSSCQSPRIASVRVGTLQSGPLRLRDRAAWRTVCRTMAKTLLFEASDDDASQWDCSGGDLPSRFPSVTMPYQPERDFNPSRANMSEWYYMRLRTQPPRSRRCKRPGRPA
jgi:type IV pilus assembly protein PilA